MAALDISASVPRETVAAFMAACDRYRTDVGNSQTVAIRRGTIALVRGLRARTAKSKSMVPARDVFRFTGEGPKYITKKGRKQKPQRRWTVVRRRGTPAERRLEVPAESKAEARRRSGTLVNAGLARQSWGWFMNLLFKRSAPKDTKGTRWSRADRNIVDGYFREVVTGEQPRVEVLILNKLDYIGEALPEHALSEAMEKATKYINGQIDMGLAKAKEHL